MKFKDFIQEGYVKKTRENKSLIESLLKNSKRDLEFLRGLKIDKNSSGKLMTNYYDVLRSILEAICSKEGYKVYSHKAYTFFLKEIKEEEISIKYDRLRRIRNSISYYGKEISIEETRENINEIKKMINYLTKKYLD